MKPKKYLSSMFAGILLIVLMATNFVVPVAQAASIPAEMTSIGFERNSNDVEYWVGDVIRAAENNSIVAWTEPDLTGCSYTIHGQMSVVVTRIMGNGVYEVYIPKSASPYYAKLDGEDGFNCICRQGEELEKAEAIQFLSDIGSIPITAKPCSGAAIVGYLDNNQVIKNYEIVSIQHGWIKLAENQYVNLGSYRNFVFIKNFENETTITTSAVITTTTTAEVTTTTTTSEVMTTTTATEEPIVTTVTNVSIPKYEVNDVVVVKADYVCAYSLNEMNGEILPLNEYDGFKIKSVYHPWYIVEFWNEEELYKIKIAEENCDNFALVYREKSSETPTTTSTTTSSTTTETTTSETSTSSTTTTYTITTNVVTTPDVPAFEENSVVKFIGTSWGERAKKSFDGEPVAYFTSENPYICLGKYWGDGWYEVKGNGTYVNIVPEKKYLFEDISCSYEPNTKLVFSGSEWNIRETAAWGQNVIGTYPSLTVVTVCEGYGNWYRVVDECDISGWIFVDPNIWVEYENEIEPPEEPTDDPVDTPEETPEETLFQAGDTVMVKSWDDWALRSAQDWSADVVKLRVPRGNTITVIKALSERWFLIEYQENLYYMNIPEGQEEWFEKIS